MQHRDGVQLTLPCMLGTFSSACAFKIQVAFQRFFQFIFKNQDGVYKQKVSFSFFVVVVERF